MFAEFGVLNYLTYLVGAVFIILVPGPNTFFVLKTGIAHGVKKGYLAAAGVFIGDAVLMFLAFAGVATLIKTTPVLFNVVRYLGAIYLLWLGGKMLYAVLTQRDGQSDASAEPASAILKRSLTLSLTNPKAILFYVSFFVQFIDVNAFSYQHQLTFHISRNITIAGVFKDNIGGGHHTVHTDSHPVVQYLYINCIPFTCYIIGYFFRCIFCFYVAGQSPGFITA